MKLEDLGVSREEGVLTNGARVVVFERPAAPIAIRCVFKSGSMYDPVGKEGLAHFTEHLLVAGTKKYPSKDKMAYEIEQIGGMFGAATAKETQRLSFQIAESEDLAVVVGLMNEILTHSLFDPKVIETERGSIRQEIDTYDSNPSRASRKAYWDIIFDNHALHHSIIGQHETVSGITRSDLQDFYSSMFSADRMTVVASGDINIDTLIGALNNGLHLPVPTKSYSPILDKVEPRTKVTLPFSVNDQLHFNLGFQTHGFTHQDSSALAVLAMIIGGGRAATLSRILRYERGLVYGVNAQHESLSQSGSIFVGGACAKTKFDEVQQLIFQEFHRIYSGGISKKELEFVQNKFLRSLKFKTQTSSQWVARSARDEVFETGKTAVNSFNEVKSLTLNDLKLVGKNYFQPGSLRMVVAGRVEDSDISIDY